jgi:threonine aldolase
VFGNQVCILTASSPGDEVIVREKGHVIKYENGSSGMISRVMTRALDCPEGLITPDHLRKVFRKNPDSQSPHTKVLILEYPTFEGLIPPLDLFNECCLMAKARGIHVHVDGARVHNALAEVSVDPAEVFKNVSSLTFCLSKGLCSPMGSMVVGDR